MKIVKIKCVKCNCTSKKLVTYYNGVLKCRKCGYIWKSPGQQTSL